MPNSNQDTDGPPTHATRSKDDDAWKHQPPYKFQKDFQVEYEANCQCKKIKYQLSRKEPLNSKLCHCSDCQRQHGAPFQWAAIFHKEDINFLNGAEGLEWFHAPNASLEHTLPCKVHCHHCKSPIMDEGKSMILLFPGLIHFKSKKDMDYFNPKCHIFYGQRVIDIPDGLPKWDGLDEKSKLIEDSPEDIVKEYEQKRKSEENDSGKDSKKVKL
ncbi:hypothetical protein BT63DRAFT_371929 [Microthyrium microscopicum]|uniref:CENP-V/GFA domain-containing protein n=1 Tax=Microthyrium microscopicum TaxID=703497 RepID=A0A6A6UC34_9PEZI|nr:hypothetical protein BT63DRAFT_371929 [Microthyrium microscopicum]